MLAAPPPTCPICKDSHTRYHRSCTDRRRGLAGAWDFWACSRCGTLFQHPTPTFAQLQSYYATYSTSGEANPDLPVDRRAERLRRWYHRLSGDVDPRDFVPATSGIRVLDYGCGTAPYLAHFRARGANISGAEIAPAIVATYRAAGLDVVLIEKMEQIPFPDHEFEIVYMMQVLEHIADPHGFLNEVRRILKPAGAFYLAVPNARSVWRRVFGANWVSGWFAPFHLFVYSLTGIRVLAQLHGFDIVRSWSATSDSWFRLNLKALLYKGNNSLDFTPKMWLDRALVRATLLSLLRLVEAPAGDRDCLVVELKKC